MSWLWIIILSLIGIFVLVKLKRLVDAKQHITYKMLLVLLVLAVISIVYVKFKSGIDITSYKGFLSLWKSYYNWILSLGGNMKNIAGYAIHQNWAYNNTAY